MRAAHGNVLLAVAVVVIAGVPALMALGVIPSPVPDAAWSGGDTQIAETASRIREEYRPWFRPLFSPADQGIERYLFGLQAFLGTAALSGLLGWLGASRQHGPPSAAVRRRLAGIGAAGIAVFGALFLVQTERGELQSFLSAVQGVGLGSLGYVIGAVAGRRAARTASGRARAA